MKKLCQLVITSISLSLCISVFASNTVTKVTYQWKNEQGITQYTERPPKDRAYEKITVSASGSREVTNITAAEAKEKTTETTESALDEVVKANERNCKIAKQNMEVLKNMARIRVSDDKGSDRILSPEEKQGRVDETQKQIDIYCKDIRAN